MTQKRSKKTLKEIEAAFVEIPTESDPDAQLKDLRVKITENNYKLCLFAELFQKKAQETAKANKDDPKIEKLKMKKAAIKELKKLHEKIKAEEKQLRDELMDLKLKRKKTRFFDKTKQFFVEYREKTYPMLMIDYENKAGIIDELNKKDYENDMREITEELEQLKKENQSLSKTEESVIEMRSNNKVIKDEICKLQAQNVEIDSKMSLLTVFDECILENQIDELEAKCKLGEEKMILKEFKNPNDYPELLVFLDKVKKMQAHEKRKMFSEWRPPIKRRKIMSGSYSLHDDEYQNRSMSHLKASMQNGQLGSRSKAKKALVMESYGMKIKTTDDSSAYLTNKESNEQENILRRTFSSTNLVKSPKRSSLQHHSTAQMPPNASNSGMPQKEILRMPKGRKQSDPSKHTDEYKIERDVYLMLQTFPSIPLFPEEPQCDKPKKSAKRDSTLERMETEVILENPFITIQPSTEQGLRTRKNIKVQKLLPKQGNRKKVKSHKDKKDVRAKKKARMIVDDQMNSQMEIDDNTDKLMVVDENLTIESFADYNYHNESSILESTGINQMDVDSNVENQGNSLIIVDEVNMEEDSPKNGKDSYNIDMLDVEKENIDAQNVISSDFNPTIKAQSLEMSMSLERLFSSSSTLSSKSDGSSRGSGNYFYGNWSFKSDEEESKNIYF